MIHNQVFKDIKTKRCCSVKCLERLFVSIGLTFITVIVVYTFNPYGIKDLIIEYFNLFLEQLRNRIFIDPANDKSGAWEISPTEGVSFLQLPFVNESNK
jgi:hypothetical protein